jgi:GNAT superfamily N-acetyltransferase
MEHSVRRIQQIDEFDDRTRQMTTAWWRTDDQLLFGRDAVDEADLRGRYSKPINLAYEIDEEVVGVAIGKVSVGFAYLHQLIVHDDYRGQGVGSALLCEFEAVAVQLDCLHLALRTQSQRARQFYEARGWSLEFVSPDWTGGLPCYQLRKYL